MVKMGHVTVTMSIRRWSVILRYILIYSTCTQNLATLASAILEIWLPA